MPGMFIICMSCGVPGFCIFMNAATCCSSSWIRSDSSTVRRPRVPRTDFITFAAGGPILALELHIKHSQNERSQSSVRILIGFELRIGLAQVSDGGQEGK